MNFIEEIKKPFNFISLTIGIIGIFLSIFFFLKSQKSKEISYQFEDTSSLLYDSNNLSSSILISYKDSLPIRNNVYLINGVIWNSGDYEIEKKDVRKVLNIALDNHVKIIDYKILEEKDKSISGFKLNRDSFNTLTVDWDYFDPKFGFKFQIIYENSKPSQINLKGKIFDIDEFKIENRNNLYDKYLTDNITKLVGLLFIISIVFKDKIVKNVYLKFFMIITLLSLIIFNLLQFYDLLFPNMITFK